MHSQTVIKQAVAIGTTTPTGRSSRPATAGRARFNFDVSFKSDDLDDRCMEIWLSAMGLYAEDSFMNSVFTGSAGTRMRVGFAPFYGSNTRHKFDYSPSPP